MRLDDLPNQGPAATHLVSVAWRALARTCWLVLAWNYRRQAKAQNKHAAKVNQRVAYLIEKARAAEEKARGA